MEKVDKINVDGTDYNVITTEEWNPYDICASLKNGQIVSYHPYWFYRTSNGECRACYKNDTSNNWGV
jgi:hypothetical protein